MARNLIDTEDDATRPAKVARGSEPGTVQPWPGRTPYNPNLMPMVYRHGDIAVMAHQSVREADIEVVW